MNNSFQIVILPIVRNGIPVDDENCGILNTSILVTLVKYENIAENKGTDTSI